MNLLKAEREKKGLTQANMAQLLGISRSFYGLIEKGCRQPTYGLATKIADLFGAKVDAIFFDIEGFRLKRKAKGA